MAKPKRDYEVGYKKPPVHSRWKKGQSGYRGARKKKKRHFPSPHDQLVEAFMKLVTVTENGVARQITKYEAAMTQLANKAASGHMPTINRLLPLWVQLAEIDEKSADESWNGINKSVGDVLIMRLNKMRERALQANPSGPGDASKKAEDYK